MNSSFSSKSKESGLSGYWSVKKIEATVDFDKQYEYGNVWFVLEHVFRLEDWFNSLDELLILSPEGFFEESSFSASMNNKIRSLVFPKYHKIGIVGKVTERLAGWIDILTGFWFEKIHIDLQMKRCNLNRPRNAVLEHDQIRWSGRFKTNSRKGLIFASRQSVANYLPLAK